MVVTGARTIRLADGEDYPSGYLADEVRQAYEEFDAAGAEVVVATPGGRAPQPEPWGLEPGFHYPRVDEDFMFSVLRRFAYHPDRGRVVFAYFDRLNLVALRRIYLALHGAGMEAGAARRTVESAAQRSWRRGTDLFEVLAADSEVTSLLSAGRMREIGNELSADSRANARETLEVLSRVPGLREPRSLGELTDEEVLGFDAVFLPGGHGVVVDLVDDAHLGRILRLLHGAGRIVAALCHGPAALLSAPTIGGAWMFHGYQMTAFTDLEERQNWLGTIGLPRSVETELGNRGALFDHGDAAWLSHVVIDRNLVTGQNVGSSEAVPCAVLRMLEGGLQ
jgi:putative intracellular protease/amidase